MSLAVREHFEAQSRAALPPIDRVHLARYTLGNLALEIEVLGLFADQAPATLRTLAAARTDKAWRDAAHTLKGSARAVGAFRVAASAEAAERLAFSVSAGTRLAAVASIADALDEACLYIAGLGRRG